MMVHFILYKLKVTLTVQLKITRKIFVIIAYGYLNIQDI
jgi:hypothetical protein